MGLLDQLSAPRGVGLEHTFGSLSIHLDFLGNWVLRDEIEFITSNVLEFLVLEKSRVSLREILSRARRESVNAYLLLEKGQMVSVNSFLRWPVSV